MENSSASLKPFDVALQEAVLTEPKPAQTALTLGGVALARHGVTEPVIRPPKLSIETIKVDRAQRHIEVGPITMDEAKVLIRRHTDGQLDLAQLFAPAALAADSTPDAISSPASKSILASVTAIPIPGNKSANLGSVDVSR